MPRFDVAEVHEHGDYLYLTAPVGMAAPEQTEIDTFAFAEEMKLKAPNPNIMWMRGQYVEADNANENGDQWRADDIAIKALTPVLMPITVMHDFRASVGVIADTTLLTPNKDQVPRARIDNMLAMWAHRYPAVAEEAQVNAKQGTLMQSMECRAPHYDCSACGTTFLRLPGGAERENWCSHLKGEDLAADQRAAARILGNVCFTGTGLIFGTQGARGALPTAHLEVEELAEFHARVHAGSTPPKRRKHKMPDITIDQAEYDGLKATEHKLSAAEEAKAAADAKVEEIEAAKVKAEEERDAEKGKREQAEEKARRADLGKERLEKLGPGFAAKLAKLETTKKRVEEQATTLSDEDWESRLAELEETLATKRDAKADGQDGDDPKPDETAAGGFFDKEVIARSNVGGGGDGDPTPTETEPSDAARDNVIGGLFGAKPKTEAKA